MTASDGAATRRAAAAHVFVDDLEAPVLGGDDAHHLGRVLRLRAGEVVTLADGVGRWRVGRFDGAGVVPDGPVVREERPTPPVAVAAALLKGDRTEHVVQKLTELGVDEIVPLVADRCVVRWSPAQVPRRMERLRSVARAAAMQSRQLWLPVVGDPVAPSSLADREGAARAEPEGPPPGPGTRLVLVGPEGGWAAGECETIRATVGLGPSVLRADTAAVVAGALLTALRAGVVAPRS